MAWALRCCVSAKCLQGNAMWGINLQSSGGRCGFVFSDLGEALGGWPLTPRGEEDASGLLGFLCDSIQAERLPRFPSSQKRGARSFPIQSEGVDILASNVAE